MLREGFLFRGREALGGLEAGKPGGARRTTKETPGRGQEKERKKSRESKKSKYSVMKRTKCKPKHEQWLRKECGWLGVGVS